MKKLSFVLLTLVILSAYSCGKRNRDHGKISCYDPKPQNSVSGVWRLQTTSSGVSGAQTCTKNIVLTINADNTYNFVTNGAKTSQGTYSLVEKSSQVHQTTKQFLDFSSDGSFILDSSVSEKLGLGQDVANGLTYSYSR